MDDGFFFGTLSIRLSRKKREIGECSTNSTTEKVSMEFFPDRGDPVLASWSHQVVSPVNSNFTGNKMFYE